MLDVFFYLFKILYEKCLFPAISESFKLNFPNITQEKIKSDIKEAGFDVEKFQKSGILIDSEADASVENDQNR